MGALEWLILRLVFWVIVPLLLIVLAVGPDRFRRGWRRVWDWLTVKRLEPEEILAVVMRQHNDRIDSVGKALAQSESAEADISRNIRKSQENMSSLEVEAQQYAVRNDDLGARAALYKLNLEKLAVAAFQERLERQRQLVADTRRRLYLLELQLRQYEVGRSILLSQLAQAKTVEQQYAIANNFDPFNAVAHWRQAEGIVQDRALNALAVEQVLTDVAEIPLTGQPAQIEPAALDAQLVELKAKIAKGGHNGPPRF